MIRPIPVVALPATDDGQAAYMFRALSNFGYYFTGNGGFSSMKSDSISPDDGTQQSLLRSAGEAKVLNSIVKANEVEADIVVTKRSDTVCQVWMYLPDFVVSQFILEREAT